MGNSQRSMCCSGWITLTTCQKDMRQRISSGVDLIKTMLFFLNVEHISPLVLSQ